MSRLLIHNLSFIAINCIKLGFRIATVQVEIILKYRNEVLPDEKKF